MGRRFVAVFLALLLTLGACDDPTAEEFIRRSEDHRRNGDISASIIELKNALQKEPKNARARLLLGRAYLSVRDLASAEKELLRAREFGVALDSLAEPLTEIWLARQQYDKVLSQLDAKDMAAPKAKLAVLVAQGTARQAFGDLDRAKQDFAAALAQDSDSVMALVGLARIALQRGGGSEADAAVARAYELAPDDLNVLALKGDHDFRRGDYASAEAHYRKVHEARPDSVALRLALARTQIGQNKPEQAIPHLDFVLSRVKAHPDANYLRASLAVNAEGTRLLGSNQKGNKVSATRIR